MLLFASWLALAPRPAQAAGPIPEPIESSGLDVSIELYATLPQTGSLPNARLNVLHEEPGGAARLFVNDLNGFLYSLDKTTREASTYLDFTTEFPQLMISPGLASGFVSFTFHPEFSSNGKLYTIHSEKLHTKPGTAVVDPPLGNITQTSVLTEWTAGTPSANTFDGSRRELLRVGTPGRFHPMGDVSFNPTADLDDPDYGLLYVSIGDGQSFNTNQSGNLQRLDSLLGSILRLDPEQGGQSVAGLNDTYSVPISNPWANDNDASTLAEVFANGFRNPHRLAWDRASGTLLVTDIGERNVEEVNVVRAGANYGWPGREGTFLVGGGDLPENDRELGFAYPAAQYDHDEGNAISNGVAYRGNKLPELNGKFIFGDIVNGRIFYADLDALLEDGLPEPTAETRELRLLSSGEETNFLNVISASSGSSLVRADLRLGEDESGQLYFMSKQTGEIYIASTNLSVDCNRDGIIDSSDLDCACSLVYSERELLFSEVGTLSGDLDVDGEVGFSDFLILASSFSDTASYLEGDLDCGGTVDFADFLILAAAFGQSVSVVQAVPEPSVTLLGWAAVFTLLGFRPMPSTFRRPAQRAERAFLASSLSRENVAQRGPRLAPTAHNPPPLVSK